MHSYWELKGKPGCCFDSDSSLTLPAFFSAENVLLVFLAILGEALDKRSILGLQDLSFSSDVPKHRGTAHATGYLHASCKNSKTTVNGWLFYDKKNSENMRWTPVEQARMVTGGSTIAYHILFLYHFHTFLYTSSTLNPKP